MIIYRGIYMDAEMLDDGTNIQVEKRIDITDLESNPYNIQLTSEVFGPSTLYTFTFGTLPPDTTGTSIGWSSDGGITWSSSTGGMTSPRTILLPTAPYLLSFTIQRPSGNIYWNSEDTIIELELTDDPCRDIVIDNSEEKFTPIRARQLQISIYSSNDIDIDVFSQGGDNRFSVDWYIDDVLNFTGWLSMGDMEQEILPDPNVIILTAVDGLGYLSDLLLTDFDGNNPENECRIIDFLLWALAGTGKELNLRAMFNIREETALPINSDTTGTGHLFYFNWLDAKTFEDKINVSIDAYEAISRILGHEAVLFQYLGEWRIVRIDEMEYGINGTWYGWDWQGATLGRTYETNEASVGVGEEYSWMDDDGRRSNQRMIKMLKLIFNYRLPLEIPCNKDFERGEIIDDSSPTEKTYNIECWQKLWSNTSTDDEKENGIYIKREFANDTEAERYVVLEADSDFTFIKSSRIFCNAKDKFTLNVTRRLSSDVGGSGAYRDADVQVRLYGDDGTFWTCHPHNSGAGEQVRYWEQCTSTFRTNQHWFYHEGNASDDQREAVSLYDGESAEIPVSGYIQILIYRSSLYGSTRDTYIDSMTLDYYANGSYRKYTAHERTIEQDVRTRNIKEEEVYLDNSPSRQFKGALLVHSGNTEIYSGSATFSDGSSVQVPGDLYSYFLPGMRIIISGSTSNNISAKIVSVNYLILVDATQIVFDEATVSELAGAITISEMRFSLAGLFYNGAQEPDGPLFPKQYGEIQAFDVWNQFNRTIMIAEGTVDHSNPAPALINKWFLTDFPAAKMFLLLHYEYDSYLCEWRAYFMETSDQNELKSYTGHSLKYITNG
jgi:hypothetical protein